MRPTKSTILVGAFPAYSRLFPDVPASWGKKYFAIRRAVQGRDGETSGSSGMVFVPHIFDAQEVMIGNTAKTAYHRVSPRIFWGLFGNFGFQGSSRG
jgi:hypothetical protein